MDSPVQDKAIAAPSEKQSVEALKKSYQIIVFKLGREEYALSIEQIKEVVTTPEISRIPLTPSYIKGVGNIRGNVLAILDLGEKFGLPSDPNISNGTHKFTLVVASEEVKMGILVKEVPNTLRITGADIDDSPNIIKDNSLDSSYIKGIVRSGNRMIVLIDIFKVINPEHLVINNEV